MWYDSCPNKDIRNIEIKPKNSTELKHVFLTIFTSKLDSRRISVKIFTSKFHPNYTSKYRQKMMPAFISYDFNVADIMSPTFLVNRCRRKCRRHTTNVADNSAVISVIITRILVGFTGEPETRNAWIAVTFFATAGPNNRTEGPMMQSKKAWKMEITVTASNGRHYTSGSVVADL